MTLRTVLASFAALGLAACAHAQQPPPPGAPAAPPGAANPTGRMSEPVATGPVRNQTAVDGREVATLRYWKIRKGSFPQFLEASQKGVWPFFEKIGARVVGMWLVVPGPGSPAAGEDFDEVYLMTRYASVEHWAATRDAEELGGDGPDAAAFRAALAVRSSLSLESRVTFLEGFTGPNGPYFMPGTGERFQKVE